MYDVSTLSSSYAATSTGALPMNHIGLPSPQLPPLCSTVHQDMPRPTATTLAMDPHNHTPQVHELEPQSRHSYNMNIIDPLLRPDIHPHTYMLHTSAFTPANPSGPLDVYSCH